MKLKNLIYIATLLLAGTSCSDSYLDTTPEGSVGKETIFESTENAKLAINGICRAMYMQYLGTQAYNGEGTIKLLYGNYPGADYQKSNRTGWQLTINSMYMENNTVTQDYYPWYYYYKLIGNANAVLANIDAAEGKEVERRFIKAQALTFRAYAYTMLSQLYCDRWQDSNNGATRGLPLRLDESNGDLAPSTLAEVYKQIYQDLDEAIAYFEECYDESGLDREDFYTPNLDVANCVYARAALIREDWATAAKYAPKAVEMGYELMSVDEYVDGGFNTPNYEWIWASDGSSLQRLLYYGFFAYQGSNANTIMCRTYPAAISKELYDQIPESDVRRYMFLRVEDGDDIEDYSVQAKTNGSLYKRAKNEYGSKLYSTSTIYPYMQFKFQCGDNYGCGDVNHFRVSEMYLIEAEADYHLGKEAEARRLLEELVCGSGRDPEYSCDKSGEELLEEIRLYRRIELWGEGFDWFDLKRWKLPRVRKTSAEGGSFKSNFAGTLEPEDANNWVWVYPYSETAYNGLINSVIDQTEQPD